MNLLEATETLIDAARQLPENRKLTQAIKRMEKRTLVLRIRARKAFRRRRWRAWYSACAELGVIGRGHGPRRLGRPICRQCPHMFSFRDFCHHAEVSGAGMSKRLECPQCGHVLIEKREPGGTYFEPENLEAAA